MAVGVLLAPRAADACATCTTGNPTITAMGEEQPFGGRTRVGISFRGWGQDEPSEEAAPHTHDTDGAHLHEPGTSLRELRADLTASFAVNERLVLALGVPLQARQLTEGGDAQRVFGNGDAELGVRYVLWRDGDFRPRHLVSAIAGLKLPTTPARRDDAGRQLPLDLQPGTGSFDPRVGLAWAYLGLPVGAQAQVLGVFPGEGFDGYRVGPSVRASAALHYQPWTALGLRAGVEGRVEGAAMQNGEEADEPSEILYLAPAVMLTPKMDWAIQLSVHVPVLARGAARSELPTFGLGVATDL